MQIGSFNENEPMFVLNRELLSLGGTLDRIRAAGEFELRLEERGSNDEFHWPVASDLSIITGASVNNTRIYSLVEFDNKFLEDCDLRHLGREDETRHLVGYWDAFLRHYQGRPIRKESLEKWTLIPEDVSCD